MKYYLTMSGNRAVDRYAIQERGIPGVKLMGAAGKAVVAAAREEGLLPPITEPILVLCGKGNNGGDGFVVALTLDELGYEVNCILAAEPEQAKGDAAHYLQQVLQRSISILPPSRQAEWESHFDEAALIFDGLLGTGISGSIRPPYDRLLSLAEASGKPVVAIDVPSGVTGDTGAVLRPCLAAHLTVSMGYGKAGLLFHPARQQAGKVVIADIGFPDDSLEHIPGEEPILKRLEPVDFPPNLLARSPAAHKYQVGKVAVIAGSRGFSGAAILAAEGALRVGAGLVRLAVPASLGPVVESLSREVIVDYQPETSTGQLSRTAYDQLMELAAWADVVALGPGLGRQEETQELARKLISSVERPLVLDADGLFAVSSTVDLLLNRKAPTVLTPHSGEFKRLAGIEHQPNWRDALDFARKYKVYLMLKGAPSLLTTPTGEILVNDTGNPGMATGGTGDVLTGMIAGLMAQRDLLPLIPACAMFLHGLAGDKAAADKSIWGMTAGDLLDHVPYAMQELFKA